MQQVAAVSQFNSQDWVSSINVPTLIIAGVEDFLTPVADSEYMHSQIHHSRLIIQAGAHVPMVEIPDIYVKEISDFLNG
jgi:pimeloyl-ACP methyl ester carboxylesterase